MHIRVILFIIYMIICLPLFVLYIIVIGLLIVRSVLSSSFYSFFIYAGIIDLTYFSMTVFLYYLPFLPGVLEFYARFQDDVSNSEWRPEYSWMLSIANMLMYYLPAIQDATNLLISLNRILALLFPFMYRKVFTRPMTLVMIFSTTFNALISCFVTIAAPGFFMEINDDNSTEKIYMLHADSKVHFPSINRSTLISAYSFTCNGLCFLIYCISGACIIRSKAVNLNEVRLFLLGFLVLLSSAPSIGYQIYWSIMDTDGSSKVFMLLPWVIMVKSLASPLLLILTNSGMRKEIRSLLPRTFRGRVKESIIRDLSGTSAK